MGKKKKNKKSNLVSELINDIEDIHLPKYLDETLIDIINSVSEGNFDIAQMRADFCLDYHWVEMVDSSKKDQVVTIIEKMCKLVNPQYITRINLDELNKKINESAFMCNMADFIEESILYGKLLELRKELNLKCGCKFTYYW